MIFPSWCQLQWQVRRTRRSSNSWHLLRRQARPEMKTISIRSCPQGSTQRTDSCGSVMSLPHLPREWTLSICRMNLTRDFRPVRPVRLAYVPLEKNYTLNASTSWSDRLPFNVLREGSSWSESEMKSRWPFQLTRHCMRAQSHTAWGKPWWQSRKRMIWQTR